jgi:hypothetical protein
MQVKDVKQGEALKLLKGSQAVYVCNHYDRKRKRYNLTRRDDVSAVRFVEGSTEVTTSFDCKESLFMLSDTLREVYLDFVNNYLTLSVYAEHNGLTVEQAKALIQLGRECHESYCNIMKEA